MKNVDSSEILIFQRGVPIHTLRKNMARPRANMLFNGDNNNLHYKSITDLFSIIRVIV